MSATFNIIVFLVLAILALCIYFLPASIAANKKNAKAIFLLNLFLGWTLIGWVVALVWANMKEDDEEEQDEETDENEEDEDTKKCPFCAEAIKKEAIVCRFCQRDIV